MFSSEVVVLNRARTTFQRVCDAKFFNGWIKSISPDAVVVHTCTNARIEPGQEFSFQVYGNLQDAFFHARLANLHGSDFGPMFGADRSSGIIALELGCMVTTELQMKPAEGQPRFCIEGLTADVVLDADRRSDGGIVIDIGPGGFAVLTKRHFRKHDLVKVTLYADGQIVQCEAEVRNCIKNSLNADYQRTGLQIRRMERVDALRWKQLYLAILENNKLRTIQVAEVGTVLKRKSRDAA